MKPNRHSSRSWNYRSDVDQIGHILYPGYFDEVRDMLTSGDFIFVTGADGFEAMFVKSVSPLDVVRVKDMEGGSEQFP